MRDVYSNRLLSFLFGVRVLSVGFRLILAFPSWEHPFSSIPLLCVYVVRSIMYGYEPCASHPPDPLYNSAHITHISVLRSICSNSYTTSHTDRVYTSSFCGLRANGFQYQLLDMSPTPDQGWKIYVGTLTTIVPATLAVGARFLARWIGGIHYWWDDWMVLIALVRLLHALPMYFFSLFFSFFYQLTRRLPHGNQADCWAMTGLRLAAVKYFGHGKHAADLPEETVIKFDKVCAMLNFDLIASCSFQAQSNQSINRAS